MANKKLLFGILAIAIVFIAGWFLFRCCYDTSYEDKDNYGRICPETEGYTYFYDYKLINSQPFLINTYKPLTEEQIEILRNSGVRKLSASEIETVYHSLIEESRVEEVKKFGFIKVYKTLTSLLIFTLAITFTGMIFIAIINPGISLFGKKLAGEKARIYLLANAFASIFLWYY